jgi:hypothetical protein
MYDQLSNNFKKNVYLKPDAYLNGWAKKCGWKATLVYDSLWRHADEKRQCFPSVELMAEEHGVSRDTIMRGLKTLIEFNLVSKEVCRSNVGTFLRNIYTLLDKTKWKEPTMSPTATRSTKSLTASNQVAHSDYKDTHKKDTHISSLYNLSPLVKNSRKNGTNPRALKPYSKLKDITDCDLQEIADKYHLPLNFVQICFEKMTCWLEAKNKKYANYKRGLMGWVLREAQEKMANKKGGFVDATNL